VKGFPDLRILHSLQALIYVVVIVLVRRSSAWGFGADFSIVILWNAMCLFITHLIQTGAIPFWLLLSTGHAEQLVPMTVALDGIGGGGPQKLRRPGNLSMSQCYTGSPYLVDFEGGLSFCGPRSHFFDQFLV
jgi:hypothetical protein